MIFVEFIETTLLFFLGLTALAVGFAIFAFPFYLLEKGIDFLERRRHP